MGNTLDKRAPRWYLPIYKPIKEKQLFITRDRIGTQMTAVRADAVRVGDTVAFANIISGREVQFREITDIVIIGDDVEFWIERFGIDVEWFTTSIGNAVTIAWVR